jgi:hypothetical protein
VWGFEPHRGHQKQKGRLPNHPAFFILVPRAKRLRASREGLESLALQGLSLPITFS